MPNSGKDRDPWKPKPTQPSSTATWLLISRIAALAIVFALLVAFLLATALGTQLDRTVVLAFLSIASGLLFGAGLGGWILVRRNGGSPPGG